MALRPLDLLVCCNININQQHVVVISSLISIIYRIILSYYCSILVTRLYTAYSVHYWATIQNVVFVHDMIWAMRVHRSHILVFRLPLAFTVNCSLLLLARLSNNLMLTESLLFFQCSKVKAWCPKCPGHPNELSCRTNFKFQTDAFLNHTTEVQKGKMFDIWFVVRNTTTLIANVCEVQQLLTLLTINYLYKLYKI